MVPGLSHVIVVVVWISPICYSGSAELSTLTWLWWSKDASIWPPTALWGVETLYIYIRWKCNPVWSGSCPNPCHSCSGMFCTQLWARFSQLSPPPWLWWSKDASIWQFTALEFEFTLYIYIYMYIYDGSLIQSELVLGLNHVIVEWIVPNCYSDSAAQPTSMVLWSKDDHLLHWKVHKHFIYMNIREV